MNEFTRKALLASIQHWKENETAENLNDFSYSASKCALCGRFNEWDNKDHCTRDDTGEMCPVYVKTGLALCDGSPYLDAVDAWCDWNMNQTEEAEKKCREATKAEREFLESLLPENENA